MQVDLLSMDDDEDDNSHQAQASSSSTAASGGGGGGGGGGGDIGIGAEVLPNLRRWFNEAMITKSTQRALLYEDAYIAIQVTSEFRLHHGRLALFFANRTSDTLEAFTVNVPQSEYLKVAAQDPPARIGASEEVRMALAVECLAPFSEVPAFEVSFRSSSGTHTYPLRLPITAASFFEPIPSDKPTYFARWKALEADRTEVQEVFTSSRPVDAQLMTHIRTVVVPGLHIGLAVGLDNELTVTGSCSFRSAAAGGEGQPAVIGAMVRLEADVAQNRFRVTVRAKHATISQALKNVLQAQLI
jgi:hypothetical protein